MLNESLERIRLEVEAAENQLSTKLTERARLENELNRLGDDVNSEKRNRRDKQHQRLSNEVQILEDKIKSLQDEDSKLRGRLERVNAIRGYGSLPPPLTHRAPEIEHDQMSVKKTGPLLKEYRSEIKRAILVHLAKRPDATDLEVCRALDADGSAELPASWRGRNVGRLFADAYTNSQTKRKVEVQISKVRSDLRKARLLD